MAADPYQLVGNRQDVNSSQFDRFRPWDGFAEFQKAIRDIKTQFGVTMIDRSLLEGGLARMGRLKASASDSRDSQLARELALARVDAVLCEIVAEGERIETELRAKARRMVDDHAFGNLERVAGAANDAELDATAKQLAEWWKLPAFEADAGRWQEEAKNAIDDWFHRSADQLERTINSPQFRAVMAGAGTSCDPASVGGPPQGWLGRLVSLVAQPLKGATRDVVYWVGKNFGHRFRPWGAVKLAKLLGRVGVVLGVVATAVDAVNLYRSWKGEKRRQAIRKELRGFVEQTAKEVLASLADGNEEAAGPITYLQVIQGHLSDAARDLGAERQVIQSDLKAIEKRLAAYELCMNKAWSALGLKGSNV